MDDQASELKALESILSDASAEPIKLSYALMRSITDNFSNEIGSGGFGVVYLGDLPNGNVAVKKLFIGQAFSDELFLDEIKCLIRVKHKNIVRFLGYCSDTQAEVAKFDGAYVMADVQQRLLCFEYVPNGNIQHYLKEKPHVDDWQMRYQMIKGICQGLQYLHERRISHLDLKTENVMLDAQVEPKITDLGLSRRLDKGKSRIVTENKCGTLGYIAPEIITKGEISFKSDIYALGIVVIKLLTGRDNIDLKNWHESLDVDCPQAKSCVEIARTCTEYDQDNRPTVGEIIHKLNEMESMIPGPRHDKGSSIYQVSSAFPGTKLLDVYPLELSFSFKRNKRITCPVILTNKTDGKVGFLILPHCPDRYRPLDGYMQSMSTGATQVIMEAKEDPGQLGTDKFEILMFTKWSHEFKKEYRSMIRKRDLAMNVLANNLFNKLQELGAEVHRAMLTAVVVESDPTTETRTPQFMDATSEPRNDDNRIRSIEVHPTEPWVLVLEHGRTNYIWNWQTEERIMYNKEDVVESGKFIARMQWTVMGGTYGNIIVCTSPTLEPVKEFKAHRRCVTLVAVHPSRPFLLSYGHRDTLKLWDWDHDWCCIGVFDITSPVIQVMFNPWDTNTFATVAKDKRVKTWKIGYFEPIATSEGLRADRSEYVFNYSGDQPLIAAIIGPSANIWDLQKGKRVHTLYVDDGLYRCGVCHPTRPILVTASRDGSIFVWDCNTYRLKNYVKLPDDPIDLAFIGSTRLLIAYEYTIEVMDIALE